MSATLRWTCPMLPAGSMLTARRYPASDRMGAGLVLPKVVQGGSAADPPAPSRRPPLRAPRSRAVQRCQREQTENYQQSFDPGHDRAPPFADWENRRELRIADAELELRLAGNSEEAETRLSALREEAIGAGDTVAASRASIALGLAAAASGRNAEAIVLLQEGLELAPVSPGARPDVFATLGHAYAASGRPERAVEVFQGCLDELRELDTSDLTAEIRFATYLSYALTDLGDLGHAQAVLDETLERADELSDAYSRVRLYWSLARLNDVRGRPAAALDCVRRAMALLAVTDDPLPLARAPVLCSGILMSPGRAGAAGRRHDAAERLFGQSPDVEDP